MFLTGKMLSVRFVAVCLTSIVGSFAITDPPSAYANTNTFGVFPADSGTFKPFGDVQKMIEAFIPNAEVINKVMRTVLENGLDNVATRMNDIFVRLEFLCMADGSHFMFPLHGKTDVEQEHKTVAIAVSKVLRNLKSMERADRLITNATKTTNGEMKSQIVDLYIEEYFRTYLQKWFEALNKHFEADERLATDYRRQKTEAKKYVQRDPKMDEPVLKIWERNSFLTPFNNAKEIDAFLQDKEVFRQAVVNKIFMKQATKHFTMIFNKTEHKRYLLARALITKAQTSDNDNKVNELYHKALVRAAAVTYVENLNNHISDVLFGSLQKSIESDRTLSRDIEELTKQIEVSTTYDMDMFHVDFALF